MTTYIARHPLAAVLVGLGNVLHDGAAVLRTFGQDVDGWIAHRRRAAADRHELVRMSDRELRDIGVNRACIEPIANGVWMREYRP